MRYWRIYEKLENLADIEGYRRYWRIYEENI